MEHPPETGDGGPPEEDRPRERESKRDAPAGADADAPEVNTSAPLAVNALAIIGSWGGPLVIAIGVVGLVFAFQATKAKQSNDLDTARTKAKTSLTLGVVAVLLGIMSTVLTLLQKAR